MIDLWTLGGPTSRAAAINDRSQVVGEAETKTEMNAFLWHAHEMTDLGVLPEGKTSAATAINSHDQIVGWATTKRGQKHAVLWTLRSG